MSESVDRVARLVIDLQVLLREHRGALERVAALERQMESWRAGSVAAGKEREGLLRQIWAVENVHSEAQRSTCGEGCCSEGKGYCSYDEEPRPCKTTEDHSYQSPPAGDNAQSGEAGPTTTNRSDRE